MDQLFHALLQDVYFAEKELVKTLPKLAEKSSSPDLEKAFSEHLDQTKGHVERLEKAFALIDMSPKAKRCDAILGIVAEGEEVIKEAEDPDVRDAGVLAAAQAAEHYEIARYGTLCAWAEQLGKDDVAALLHQTLQEEKAADARLTSIAESSVNREAAAAV
jgi:ferritin-like metal-binding protein YciE